MTGRFPRSTEDVPRYTAPRVGSPPALDGRLTGDCWRDAPRTDRFVDLVSGARTRLETTAALLWDDDALYAGFWVEAEGVRATLTERDAHIWEDDDVELFVAGPDAYYELEVNALNTVYEVLFVWDDAAVHLPAEEGRPWDGVAFRHPRGPRTGHWGFDLPGLRTAVHVDGGIDDATAWTVEIALPWAGFAPVGRPVPPRPGDEWRVGLARFNARRWSEADSGGWSWAPHGVWDSHIPELFPRVVLGRTTV